MTLLFASNNAHKLEEVKRILPEDVCVLSLEEVGFHHDIPETGTTLEENSAIKARTIAAWLHQKQAEGAEMPAIDGIFADDTGLEIAALGGAPGVYTARWAGEDCKAENNRAKALLELRGVADRSACFRTVVTLIRGEKEDVVDGVVNGSISEAEFGHGGFGYDPVFIPEGHDKTFAELPAEVKNSISHRARAMQALRRILGLILLLILPLLTAFVPELATVQAEESIGRMNQFRTYASYYNTNCLVAAEEDIFALSSQALYSIAVGTHATTHYDKSDGLSGSSISHIGYDEKTQKLIIIYNDGHIDLLRRGILSPMQDLYLKGEDINTKVNSIYVHDGHAFLNMTLGVVELNLQREEVVDTYPLGADGNGINTLYSTTIGDTLYAVSANSIYVGDRHQNLIDYHSWAVSSLPGWGDITGFASNDSLLFLVRNKVLYYGRPNNWTRTDWLYVNWLKYSNGEVLFGTDEGIYNAASGELRFGIQNTKDIDYLDRYYISLGTCVIAHDNGIVTDTIAVDGPMDNSATHLTIAHDRLYVASGNYTGVQSYIDGTVKVLMLDGSDSWLNISSEQSCEDIGTNQLPVLDDIINIAVDPEDANHYFATSYGMGVVEYRDNKAYKQYTDSCALHNSTLVCAAGCGFGWQNYTRCSASVMDENGYLWVTNTEVSPLHVYDIHNEKWTDLKISNYKIGQPGRDMLIDKRNPNWKWLLIRTAGLGYSAGVILFDDGGTPTDPTDDRTMLRSTFRDQKGKDITPTEYFALAQDNDGYIWVGTTKGPLCINHTDFFTSNACYRVIRRRNDGTDLADYLLETEQVNAIAVDGGNRKWIGTTNGLYLVSADGQETIHAFTSENSNLPSNVIRALAIDPKLGDVYIGTDAGLCSYRSDASESSSDFSNAYAYPNPVLPDFIGEITIVGLQDQTWVNILDAGGNLVYKTLSNGGTAIWDGTNGRGQRVASGVYSAVCTSSTSSNQTVVKILMMK